MKVVEVHIFSFGDYYIFAKFINSPISPNKSSPIIYRFTVYSLKEIVDIYRSQSSTICISYLDASRASDEINYWFLFY